VLENVLGFVTSNQGEDLYLAVNKLNQPGYQCDVLSLDAKWFVPQSRQRVFLVGTIETNSYRFLPSTYPQQLHPNSPSIELVPLRNTNSCKAQGEPRFDSRKV
jgi:site-specific DNA-cytosine methylase